MGELLEAVAELVFALAGAIVVRSCTDIGRRHRRWRAEIRALVTEPAAPDGASNVADRDQLERGLRRLTPAQQAILVMHF